MKNFIIALAAAPLISALAADRKCLARPSKTPALSGD